jgi:6-phosphogluconolactonase
MHLLRTLQVLLLMCPVAFYQSRNAPAQSPATNPTSAPDFCLVYIGSYSEPSDEGIHVFRFHLTSGVLTRLGGVAGIKNPSFLALHPSKKFLYAVSETIEHAGQPVGGVAAMALDDRGLPSLLNMQPSAGLHPCHISLDAAGKHALVANYSSGHVTVLPIAADGRLGTFSTAILHQGKGIDPERQEGPHAHAIQLDAANRFALAADLGIDKIILYKYHDATGQIIPHDPPAVSVPAGSGPRHFVFHPSGKYVYACGELNSTVIAFTYDAERGTLQQQQIVSTLPAETPSNSTAEILIAPHGRQLYVSNRGHDSIAVFALDPATGMLTPTGHVPTGGRTPRNFGIDPTGKWLLAANQNSGNVVVFRVDPAAGILTATGQEVQVPRPVCVKFLVP